MSPTAAVVTGAASGLGLAVVRALTADGAEVVGVDLPGDERAATVEDAGATFLACDVTSADDWSTVADEIGGGLGRVDLHGRMLLQHGLLEPDPSAALARLPVGDSLQERTCLAAQAPKHVLAAVQRDASDEVQQVAS